MNVCSDGNPQVYITDIGWNVWSDGQARCCLYAKNQLLAHHFGKKKLFCLH